MKELDEFIGEMRRIQSSGGAKSEVSFYPAIERAFTLAGAKLSPRVLTIQHPKSTDGDHPDFGFFEARGPEIGWSSSPVPERGVAEAKPLSVALDGLQTSKQVSDYLDTFGLVLITNFRQYRLLSRQAGQIIVREECSLADDETSFWSLTATDECRVSFGEFIHRVLLHRAPLRSPRDVAFFLASYAREALVKLEAHPQLEGLANLRGALESALGVEFEGQEGERLFQSTLIQTLFYGLFSAWVLRSESGQAGPFDWRAAAFQQNVPVVSLLFSEVSQPHRLGQILAPLLDRATATLSRIEGEDLTAFLSNLHEDSALLYFYEPFLEAFDPITRDRMGVWYTPPEIVKYMVERVDRALRTELGIEDGLANPNVWVLDPCCGTGSFIAEVLNNIKSTLSAQGHGALVGSMLKEAATTRIFGFEIMPAPLVIANWKVAEILRKTGAPLSAEHHERASIYLTNALTGWSTGGSLPPIPGFELLQAERDSATQVKQERPILVVLGNPPYNAFAGTSPQQEQGLVEPYKEGLRDDPWSIAKYNLDDLYVRFIRIAERRVAQTGSGIVAFITNGSWITERSFVIMRQSIAKTFDRIWVDNMHGNRKISERGPDGRTSQTVFAMAGFSPGIKQGVAISLMVKTGADQRWYGYRNDVDASRAADRREQLLATLEEPDINAAYEEVDPSAARWFRLAPGEPAEEYASWPSIKDLSATAPVNGLMEKRGGSLMDVDVKRLTARMEAYCNPEISHAQMQAISPELMKTRARFRPDKARNELIVAEGFRKDNIRKYLRRPFDGTNAYVTPVRPVWNEPRPTLLHLFPDAQGFLASRPVGVSDPEGWPVFWTTRLGDDHVMQADAYYFPVFTNLSGSAQPNLSPSAQGYLEALGVPADGEHAELLWMHFLAVSYSAEWLSDHAQGVKFDWPRVPLPDHIDNLKASAELGRQVASLLDLDTKVSGVTQGTIDPVLTEVAQLTSSVSSLDLNVMENWGNLDKLGRVTPTAGKAVERAFAANEPASLGQSVPLGGETFDIYLNDNTYWRNVPAAVWNCHIGGYRVLKKWLSYRSANVSGKPLSAEEAAHFTSTARRLAKIALITQSLDDNYRNCRDAAYEFGSSSEGDDAELGEEMDQFAETGAAKAPSLAKPSNISFL